MYSLYVVGTYETPGVKEFGVFANVCSSFKWEM